MQSLSIQVHPNRLPSVDATTFGAALKKMVATTGLVHEISFGSGDETGTYETFTFSTSDVAALWELVQKAFYRDSAFAEPLKESSIVVCTGVDGWSDFVLLFHYDPAVEVGSIPLPNPTFQRTAARPLN